jgi:hypothetical protein
MLYREIITVYSQTHIKHINTLCGQNVELLSVKPGGTYSNQSGLDGSRHSWTSLSKQAFIKESKTTMHGPSNGVTKTYSA